MEVTVLSGHMRAPTVGAMQALKRLVWYLIGTEDFHIFWRRSASTEHQGLNAVLDVASDSDWADDPLTRKSRSSHDVQINGYAMASVSRRQHVYSASSG